MYCYVCDKQFDIFDIVRAKEKLPFNAAVEWVMKHAGILPDKLVTKTKQEYKGPVPSGWVKSWHDNLPDHARDYYHQRLLTDETIDFYQLGWRPDYAAYTIPFWRGMPGKSEIDTLQYRASELKPRDRKYWGEKGYTRPSVMNLHLLLEPIQSAILLIGSFDGILGGQDSLTVFGINGASAFSNPARAESKWIKAIFAHIEQKFIVPDSTHTEFEAAHKLAYMLGAEVRYFPRRLDVKDYTEFRLAGYTSDYFLEEIINMPISKGYVFGISEANIIKISDILGLVSQGQGEAAVSLLQIIQAKYPHSSGLIGHSFQQMCNRRPLQYLETTITDDEWDVMCTEFSKAVGYKELSRVIQRWADLAEDRMGAF